MSTVQTIGLSTPLGPLAITANEDGITDVAFARRAIRDARDPYAFLLDCRRQIEEYFRGSRRHFQDLPLVIDGTPFLSRVWEHLLVDIDFGHITSYQGVAMAIGQERAVRAVGSACRRNRLPIIIPCHRVVPSDLTLGNYNGGVERKKWLLDHEEEVAVKEWVS